MRRFMKMHGLGNDFVIVDERSEDPWVTPARAKAIGDRNRGVGFDQLAVISEAPGADLALTFYNPDGSMSAACGNATRCIARHEMDRLGRKKLSIKTDRGILSAEDAGNGLTSVNMGAPMTLWQDIPLAEQMDTLHLPIDGQPTAIGMGNPHCAFFVDDASSVDLASFGPAHEVHPLFPERTNVEVVQVVDAQTLRVRIWERGTGITLASGSCSCAAAVAAARRGLTGRHVDVNVDGGLLAIDWRDDGVWMTGPTAHVFDGVFTSAFFEGAG